MIMRPDILLQLVKRQKVYYNVVCVLCAFLLGSCAGSQNLNDQPVNRGASERSHVLLVNTNSSIERYHMAETSFSETLSGSTISVVDLGGNQNPIDTLQDLLNEQHYDAVYCIGAKALGSIDYIDPDMPVIFSSVLNWRRFNGQANYYGIASEVAPEAQLTWFKYFFPEIKKIGVLYSSDNQKLIQDATVSANKLSLQLVAKEVNSEGQLANESNSLLSEVEALWLISDPSVLSSTDKAKLLFEVADKKSIPVLTYNSFFVDMGAVLSVAADLPTTGRQAALMMKQVLAKEGIKASVQFPAGSRIILNMGKAKAYGMKLNEDALDSVSEVRGE